MATFKSLDSLFSHLENKVKESLQDEVFKEVQEEMIKQADIEVYQAYTPNQYNRRYTLTDPNNIIGEIDGTKLSVLNIATPNQSWLGIPYDSNNRTAFAEWIEYGQVPMLWVEKADNGGYPRFFPRPFMKTTREMLEQNNNHVKALRDGLRKRNIPVI